MTDEKNNGQKENWLKEWIVHSPWSFLYLSTLLVVLGSAWLFAKLVFRGKLPSGVETAVIYTAQDQIYAEPILRDFEKETGIRVRTLFDSEAVKTVGLANRLLAERSHPQCDVFWGNEEMRTRQLAAEGVFEKWTSFGHRSRQFVFNTNFVSLERRSPTRREDVNSTQRAGSETGAPNSLLELTNAHWRGKVALAYPLFGTTATHFLALRQHWGETGWLAWCRGLVANDALVVDGNSMVVKLVGRGEAWIGLTDSDDIAAFQREGLPVSPAIFKETLLIPNTIAIVKGAPRAESARKLFDYLQSRPVVERLVQENALQGVEASIEGGLKPDWTELLARLEQDTTALKEIFLR
jgi:iron(III) transport system substrate-binding protein